MRERTAAVHRLLPKTVDGLATLPVLRLLLKTVDNLKKDVGCILGSTCVPDHTNIDLDIAQGVKKSSAAQRRHAGPDIHEVQTTHIERMKRNGPKGRSVLSS
jgi:hypothetical protein